MNVRRVEETVVELGSKVVLRDVLIGEERYRVEVTNVQGTLHFGFVPAECEEETAAEFGIQVIDGKINLHRLVSRPNHDHDDSERLCLPVETPWSWSSRHPAREGGRYRLADIPFGAVTVEY